MDVLLENHPSPIRGFIVRPYRPSDAAGVQAVLEASYGAQATPALIYNWWSFGFHGAECGFMVAEVNGKIVGAQPMQLFPYADGAMKVRGALLTGVAVHPEFRRRGIFSALVKACEHEAWRQRAAFVTTMPNEKSRPGFLKYGYTDLGLRQLLVRPVRPVALCGRIFPGLGQLAGAGAGLGQHIIKRIPVKNDFTVREVANISVITGSLARQHERLFSGLRMSRYEEWLRWRFMESPLRKYRMFESINHLKRLAGFAVAIMDEREKFKVCYLMDILVSSEDNIAALLSAICKLARREGADAVATMISSPKLNQALCRAGFWSVPAWMPLKKFYSIVRFNPNFTVPSTWRTLEGWYQTPGDWDNL